jgi:DNA-binding SARP family transcriptional activator
MERRSYLAVAGPPPEGERRRLALRLEAMHDIAASAAVRPRVMGLLVELVRELKLGFEQRHSEALAQLAACTRAQHETEALVSEIRGLLELAPRRDEVAGTDLLDFVPLEGEPELGAAVDLCGIEAAPAPRARAQDAPSLQAHLLGPFRVVVDDHALTDWPHAKARAIFKLLLLQRRRPVARELLMDRFWPEATPQAARNSLHVAVHALRRTLATAHGGCDFDFVQHHQGCYALNPALRVWIDVEAFLGHCAAARAADARGDRTTACEAFRAAQAIHQQPLLIEDRYDDWLAVQRESLQQSCLGALRWLREHHAERGEWEACIAATNGMLGVDRCDEEAYRMLMRCQARLGRVNLALRQYHVCVEALSKDLSLIPSAETVALFQRIRRREAV